MKNLQKLARERGGLERSIEVFKEMIQDEEIVTDSEHQVLSNIYYQLETMLKEWDDNSRKLGLTLSPSYRIVDNSGLQADQVTKDKNFVDLFEGDARFTVIKID